MTAVPAKKILYGVLDWGLGHATRSMPLIASLRSQGHEVVLCGAGPGLALLQRRFPECRSRSLPPTGIRYGKDGAQTLRRLLLQIPRILRAIRRDARLAGVWAREENADAVISDGRYGFRARGAVSFFISHQLVLPLPQGWPLPGLCRKWLTTLNRRALRGFTEVWVPDYEESPSLSGTLGHPPAWPGLRYLGPLCRFEARLQEEAEPSIAYLALCSGPEPQRTLFEAALRSWLENRSGTRILLRGLPGSQKEDRKFPVPDALNVYDHAEPEEMFRWMEGAAAVVARSGYTTVMELAALGKRRVLLVPTPGQPEQEELARHLEALGVCRSLDQDALAEDQKETQWEETDRSGFSSSRGFGMFTGARRPSPQPTGEFLASHPFFRKESP